MSCRGVLRSPHFQLGCLAVQGQNPSDLCSVHLRELMESEPLQVLPQPREITEEHMCWSWCPCMPSEETRY